MDVDYLVYLLIQAAALVLGLCVHESAHALAAYLLGDRTARQQGRLSLNPLRHIDPFGTVLLPLIMMALGGPVFAFARPVPVRLGNLKHPQRDEVLVALAGPVSNILLALGMTGALSLLVHADITVTSLNDPIFYLRDFLLYAMLINLSLAFFNLIPLPPLDGSSILAPFLKGQALQTYYRIQQYSLPILIIVLYLLPQILRIDLVGWYFSVTVYPLFDVLQTLAFVY